MSAFLLGTVQEQNGGSSSSEYSGSDHNATTRITDFRDSCRYEQSSMFKLPKTEFQNDKEAESCNSKRSRGRIRNVIMKLHNSAIVIISMLLVLLSAIPYSHAASSENDVNNPNHAAHSTLIRIEPECGPTGRENWVKIRRKIKIESNSEDSPRTADTKIPNNDNLKTNCFIAVPVSMNNNASKIQTRYMYATPIHESENHDYKSNFEDFSMVLPEHEGIWGWSIFQGGLKDCENTDKSGIKENDSEVDSDTPNLNPYHGAFFRLYPDMGELELYPSKAPISEETLIELKPKFTTLPQFLPAHKEKITVIFHGVEEHKIIEANLNNEGNRVHVLSPTWHEAEDVNVELSWCSVPKERPFKALPNTGAILRYTPEKSLFGEAPIDDSHVETKVKEKVTENEDESLFDDIHDKHKKFGKSDTQKFKKQHEPKEIINEKGDHYILSRKGDSTIPTDSTFLRDLCILIISCAFFSLLIRMISAGQMDMTLGCIIGGSLVGPGGYNLVSELIQVESVAELGIIFLMFELGFSFNCKRMLKSWRAALAGGIFLTILLVALCVLYAAFNKSDVNEAILVGVFTSVSSTALVIASTGAEENESNSNGSKNNDPNDSGSTSDVNDNLVAKKRLREGKRRRNRDTSRQRNDNSERSGDVTDRSGSKDSRANDRNAKIFMKKSGIIDKKVAMQSSALVSILVAQDLILAMVLAIFPFLFGVKSLNKHLKLNIIHVELELWQWGLLTGVFCLVGYIVSRKRLVLWYVFKKSKDLQQLILLTWCLFVIFCAEQVGFFSKEVGAFIAGFLLPSTCKEIAHNIMQPLKEFFMIIFFGSIGLMMRPYFVLDNLHIIAGVWLALSILKFLSCIAMLTTIGGQRLSIALYIAACLCHVGEFAFLIIAKGKAWGILSHHVHLLLLGAATCSLFTSPLSLGLANRYVKRITEKSSVGWLDNMGEKNGGYAQEFELATMQNFGGLPTHVKKNIQNSGLSDSSNDGGYAGSMLGSKKDPRLVYGNGASGTGKIV